MKGTEKSGRQLLNPPHLTPVRDLFFVGQQSENGGVPAVINGARDAYNKAGLKTR